MPHARAQSAPGRVSWPGDELDGVERIRHQRSDARGGDALLVGEAVVEHPDGLRAKLLRKHHVLVQAQPCIVTPHTSGLALVLSECT